MFSMGKTTDIPCTRWVKAGGRRFKFPNLSKLKNHKKNKKIWIVTTLRKNSFPRPHHWLPWKHPWLHHLPGHCDSLTRRSPEIFGRWTWDWQGQHESDSCCPSSLQSWHSHRSIHVINSQYSSYACKANRTRTAKETQKHKWTSEIIWIHMNKSGSVPESVTIKAAPPGP